ncbi:hypothetical protein GCM10010317_016810 [Streptomyces mirabilis]|nr:hypothetical protein GCM10010317_016810 [Streptomyces mirabilis]
MASAMIAIRAGRDQRGAAGVGDGSWGGSAAGAPEATKGPGAGGSGSVADVTSAPCTPPMGTGCALSGGELWMDEMRVREPAARHSSGSSPCLQGGPFTTPNPCPQNARTTFGHSHES